MRQYNVIAITKCANPNTTRFFGDNVKVVQFNLVQY